MDGIAALVQQLHRVQVMQQYQLLPCCQARISAVAIPALVSVLLLAAALMAVVGVCMPPDETAGREVVNLAVLLWRPSQSQAAADCTMLCSTHIPSGSRLMCLWCALVWPCSSLVRCFLPLGWS